MIEVTIYDSIIEEIFVRISKDVCKQSIVHKNDMQ